MSSSIYELGVFFDGGVSYNVQFFNGLKWKNIDQFIQGDKVLQYNGCGQAELVEPIKWRSCHTYRKPIDVSRNTEWGYSFPLFLYEGQEIVYWIDNKQELYSTFLKEGITPGRYNLLGSCSVLDRVETDKEDIDHTEGARLAKMVNSVVKEEMNRYISSFQFSDLLYGLSKENKMIFLILTGIYDKYGQWKRDKSIDARMPLPGMTSQIATLWNMTVWENCAWADKASNTLSFGINPVINVPSKLPDGYLNECNTKFGFIVPSGKLVLRSSGIIFVLGDMR